MSWLLFISPQEKFIQHFLIRGFFFFNLPWNLLHKFVAHCSEQFMLLSLAIRNVICSKEIIKYLPCAQDFQALDNENAL